MATQNLTAELARSLLDYDPDTGILTWKPCPTVGLSGYALRGAKIFNTEFSGKAAGSPNGDGYIKVEIRGKKCLAHRLAWLIATGSWPSDEIDHINGRCDDNRLENLREATHAQNQRNRKSAPNSLGFPGVTRNKKHFVAQIQRAEKRYVGIFPTPEAAHAAYRKALADNNYDPTHSLSAEVRYALS